MVFFIEASPTGMLFTHTDIVEACLTNGTNKRVAFSAIGDHQVDYHKVTVMSVFVGPLFLKK